MGLKIKYHLKIHRLVNYKLIGTYINHNRMFYYLLLVLFKKSTLIFQYTNILIFFSLISIKLLKFAKRRVVKLSLRYTTFSWLS